MSTFPTLRDLSASQTITSWDFCETMTHNDPLLEITNQILLNNWKMIKICVPEGVLDVQEAATQVQEKYKAKGHNLPSNRKAADLFAQLSKTFSDCFNQAEVNLSGRIPTSHSEYEALQNAVLEKWEDQALLKAWNQKRGSLKKLQNPEIFDKDAIPSTPKEIRTWLTETNNNVYLNRIKFLRWSTMEMKTCPQDINNFHFLIDIDLSHNQLNNFSVDLSLCTCIKVINLGHNKLKRFTSNLVGCNRLEMLILSNNQLSKLDTDLSTLPNLNWVDLYKNPINAFYTINGQLHGNGTFQLNNGNILEGCLMNGKLNGEAKLTFPSGITCKAKFRGNKIIGRVIIALPSGDAYKGDFGVDNQGFFTGNGIEMRNEATPYKGDFVRSLRHGNGKLKLDEDEEYYEGPFRNGLPDGTGIISSPGGSREVTFVNGKLKTSEKRPRPTGIEDPHPNIKKQKK